jgi:hypothetical protein
MADESRAARRGVFVISALSPAFLAAGAALAVLPLLLHLLARRPPERRPLPTARFLSEDARTLLRIQRVPTDLPLLLVRMAFAIALGAVFAGIVWTPDRTGDGHVVLLDASADPRGDWDLARQLARSALADASGEEGSLQPILLAYGLDGGARIVDPGQLEGLERGGTAANAEDGLRALRSSILSGTRHDRVAVTWVTRSSWRLWSTGIGLLRPALWPGSTTIRPVPPLDAADLPGPTAPATATVSDTIDRDPIVRALDALGIEVEAAGADRVRTGGAHWVFSDAPTVVEMERLVAAARDGGFTVVLSGRLPGESEEIPWQISAPGSGSRGGIVVAPGLLVGADVVGMDGIPREAAKTVAVFQDATPAAAATRLGSGCLVYLAASLRDPDLTADVDFPEVVSALGNACAETEDADGPLGAGALRALERPELPAFVDVTEMAAQAGYPLSRWIALLALLLFAGEVVMTRRRLT